MTPDMQKEQFSRSYVQAVAACAGFAWSLPSVDDDSIDLCLRPLRRLKALLNKRR